MPNMNPFDLYEKPNYKMKLRARIRWWFKRHKYIRERARNGWSRYDAWDFDAYLANVIGGALEFLAKNNMSHPYEITDEDWKKKLLHISECFKQYNIEPPCPAYQAYHEAVQKREEIGEHGKCITIEGADDLYKAWLEEEKVNYEAKMKKLKEGFDLLYDIYPNLWD